jgi:hypothetical protein
MRRHIVDHNLGVFPEFAQCQREAEGGANSVAIRPLM